MIPPSSPRPRPIPGSRRRGFLLAVAVLVGLTILGLGSTYYRFARNQNVRGHRFKGALVTTELSEAVAYHLASLVRIEGDPSRKIPDAKPGKHALGWLMRLPPSAFEKEWKTLQRMDEKKLVDTLFDAKASKRIETMVERIPGAQVSYRVEIELGETLDGGQDSVPKHALIRLLAQAEYQRIRRQAETYVPIMVYPLATPVLGRFTGNTGHIWHDPKRGIPTKPLDSSKATKPFRADGRAVRPEEWIAKNQDKGWAFPRHQLLNSGTGLFGMEHLLWKAEGGGLHPPLSFLVEPQPETFLPVVSPRDQFVNQLPLLESVVAGSPLGSTETNSVPGIEPLFPPPYVKASEFLNDIDRYGMLPVLTNQEHPFGSSMDPSPTFAPGSRLRASFLSAITLDRNEYTSDEDSQTAAVGARLPQREALVSLLPDAPIYDDEFVRTRENQPRVGTEPVLFPEEADQCIPETGLCQLPNRNLNVDLDGNGSKETLVPTEGKHAPLAFWLPPVNLFRLFPDRESYQREASRVLDLPANYVANLSTLGYAEAQAELRRLSLDPDYLRTVTQEWDLSDFVLTHQDPIHKRGKESEQVHLAPTQNEEGEVRTFMGSLENYLRAPSVRTMPTVYVYGPEKVKKYFPKGDLHGLRVVVLREKEDGPSVFELNRKFHSGMLQADILEVKGPQEAKDPGESLELVAQELILPQNTKHALSFFADTVRPVGARDYVENRGNSFDKVGVPHVFGDFKANAKELTKRLQNRNSLPLVTVWDPLRDPTHTRKQRGYRMVWGGF